MKVLFETKRVQKTGRIALSEHLLRNAVQEGDAVEVYSDASTKRIILQRAAKASTEGTEQEAPPAGKHRVKA